MNKKILLTERVSNFIQSIDKSQYDIITKSLKRLFSVDFYSSPDIRKIDDELFMFRATFDLRIIFNQTDDKVIIVDIISKAGANFSRVNMTKANLEKSNFSFSNFSNANLLEANLSHAIFKEANFSKANLSSANLIGSVFKYANFDGADLSNANLKNADLTGARNLDKVKSFKNTNLANVAGLTPQVIQNAIAQGAKVEEEKI